MLVTTLVHGYYWSLYEKETVLPASGTSRTSFGNPGHMKNLSKNNNSTKRSAKIWLAHAHWDCGDVHFNIKTKFHIYVLVNL